MSPQLFIFSWCTAFAPRARPPSLMLASLADEGPSKYGPSRRARRVRGAAIRHGELFDRSIIVIDTSLQLQAGSLHAYISPVKLASEKSRGPSRNVVAGQQCCGHCQAGSEMYGISSGSELQHTPPNVIQALVSHMLFRSI